MAASTTDLLLEVGLPGSATTLGGSGYTVGNTSITVVSSTNWGTATLQAFAIDVVDADGERIAGTYNEFVGIVASATSITNVVQKFGTPQNYPAGTTTRVYIPVSATRENMIVQWGGIHANPDGTLKEAAVKTALGITGTTPADYTLIPNNPDSVTCLGNRSYLLVFNGVNLTSTVSVGSKLRSTRSVAAPVQCALLNGTNQYFSKSSPAGMTFTDDFVTSAWVKLSSYSTNGQIIMSRYNGTSGWDLGLTSSGQIFLEGYNGGSANYSTVFSRQSVPLNKWVHIAAQLDMSTFTATTTTSYIMLDGIDIPVTVSRFGTNPTSMVQAGSLEIGSWNGGLLPFAGKIAQPAVFNAKVAQATMQTYYSQGLSGSETSLISAYSLSNTLSDLNTINANNLTPVNSPVTTNSDSPFGLDDANIPSSTVTFGKVTSKVFSTNTTLTVQVPEGCTIPTTGGVATLSYSGIEQPYGFPSSEDRWQVRMEAFAQEVVPIASTNNWFASNKKITLPVGNWSVHIQGAVSFESTVSGSRSAFMALASSTPAPVAGSAVPKGIMAFGRAVAFSSTGVYQTVSSDFNVNVTTPTTYTIYGAIDVATGSENYIMRGEQVPIVISAELAL